MHPWVLANPSQLWPPPSAGFKLLIWISQKPISKFWVPTAWKKKNISANLEEGIIQIILLILLRCRLASPIPKVQKSINPALVLFLFQWSWSPYPRSDPGKTSSLTLHGFILLVVQRKAQFMTPGSASASSSWLLNAIPSIVCLNPGHLSWPKDCPKSLFLLEANSWAGFPSWGTSALFLLWINPHFHFIFGLIEEPLSSACSPRHLFHHPLKNPQVLPKG